MKGGFMNRIQIYDIRLLKMLVSTNKEAISTDVTHIQAKMEVNYDFCKKEKNFTYLIHVNDANNQELYEIVLQYHFLINEEDFLDQDIVEQFLDEMQPRLETILTIVAYESGFSKLS